jgi:hypothetical protein
MSPLCWKLVFAFAQDVSLFYFVRAYIITEKLAIVLCHDRSDTFVISSGSTGSYCSLLLLSILSFSLEGNRVNLEADFRVKPFGELGDIHELWVVVTHILAKPEEQFEAFWSDHLDSLVQLCFQRGGARLY